MMNRSRRDARKNETSEETARPSLASVNWRRLLGYLKPYRGRMGLAIVALILSTGFGLAFPAIIVQLLNSVTQSAQTSSLNLLAGLLIGIFLLQAVFGFVQSYLLAYIGERIVLDLRTSLYSHLQQLSLDFYAARRVGDLVSRLSSDVTQMRSVLTNNITSLLSQTLTLIGSVAILLTMNAQFTLFILALAPVLIGVAFVFGRRITKRQHADTRSTGGLDSGRRGRLAGDSRGQELRARDLRDRSLQRSHAKDFQRVAEDGNL